MVLHFDMDCSPDEIIGDILSRIANAREVVVASTTCKKWRRTMQFHLKSLYFWFGVEPRLDGHRMETIITQTILQTRRLESLSLNLSYVGLSHVFPADCVRTWLIHTEDSLSTLYLFVKIDSSLNIFGNKLEVLYLSDLSLSGFKLSGETSLPCVKTLHKNLTLMSVEVGRRATLELCTSALKTIYFISMQLDKFVLEADRLESLRLDWSDIQHFKLVGNGALKVLYIDGSKLNCFGVGGNIENLEDVNVHDYASKGSKLYPKLYHIISKASNLRRLRLWPVTSDNCYGFTDLEKISAYFPQLNHLSLYYLKEVDVNLQGSSCLQNVAVLELGFVTYRHFSSRIEGFVERCPTR